MHFTSFDEEVFETLRVDLFKGFLAGVVALSAQTGSLIEYSRELTLGVLKYKVTFEPVLEEAEPISDKEERDMSAEMRKAGSKLPDMVEFLQANGWETFEHHDNWIRTEWKQNPDFNGRSQGFDTHHAYDLAKLQNSDIKKAVDILSSRLRSNKKYFETWQANIAMAFYDEYKKTNINDDEEWLHRIHTIANTAAENFLNLLIEK